MYHYTGHKYLILRTYCFFSCCSSFVRCSGVVCPHLWITGEFSSPLWFWSDATFVPKLVKKPGTTRYLLLFFVVWRVLMPYVPPNVLHRPVLVSHTLHRFLCRPRGARGWRLYVMPSRIQCMREHMPTLRRFSPPLDAVVFSALFACAVDSRVLFVSCWPQHISVCCTVCGVLLLRLSFVTGWWVVRLLLSRHVRLDAGICHCHYAWVLLCGWCVDASAAAYRAACAHACLWWAYERRLTWEAGQTSARPGNAA